MDLLSTEGIAVCLKQGKHCRSSLPVSMLTRDFLASARTFVSFISKKKESYTKDVYKFKRGCRLTP